MRSVSPKDPCFRPFRYHANIIKIMIRNMYDEGSTSWCLLHARIRRIRLENVELR